MPGLTGGGSFRPPRLNPKRSKPALKKDSPLLERLKAQTPDGSGSSLGRQSFKPAPKAAELPPGFLPARAAVVGDIISCHGDVIGRVVGHRESDGVVLCREVSTDQLFGVAPNTIVEVAS